MTLDTGLGSYFDADRLANAGELQNAIWFLEDGGGQNNGYVALAESALGTNLAGIKADSNGAYDVVALNLFTPMATWLRISWRLFPFPSPFPSLRRPAVFCLAWVPWLVSNALPKSDVPDPA